MPTTLHYRIRLWRIIVFDICRIPSKFSMAQIGEEVSFLCLSMYAISHVNIGLPNPDKSLGFSLYFLWSYFFLKSFFNTWLQQAGIQTPRAPWMFLEGGGTPNCNLTQRNNEKLSTRLDNTLPILRSNHPLDKCISDASLKNIQLLAQQDSISDFYPSAMCMDKVVGKPFNHLLTYGSPI
jgi:hypothetical protein